MLSADSRNSFSWLALRPGAVGDRHGFKRTLHLITASTLNLAPSHAANVAACGVQVVGGAAFGCGPLPRRQQTPTHSHPAVVLGGKNLLAMLSGTCCEILFFVMSYCGQHAAWRRAVWTSTLWVRMRRSRRRSSGRRRSSSTRPKRSLPSQVFAW